MACAKKTVYLFSFSTPQDPKMNIVYNLYLIWFDKLEINKGSDDQNISFSGAQDGVKHCVLFLRAVVLQESVKVTRIAQDYFQQHPP